MKTKSIYKRGAEYGMIFGIYTSIMSICFFVSTQFPAASVVVLAMFVATPFLIYKLLRRCFNDEAGNTEFSALWMLGILTFLFGSLICATTSYIYLDVINPSFIYSQVNSALELYKEIPEFKDSEIIVALETAVEERKLPSAIDYVFQMIWLTSFTGSILSLFIAYIVRLIPLKK